MPNRRLFILLLAMCGSFAVYADVQIEQKQTSQTANNVCTGITPDMVVIRPNRFMMGSPESDKESSLDEKPQHQVTIPRPFAISRCEITIKQFKRFIDETGYKTTAETDGKGCYGWDTEKKNWEQNSKYSWQNVGFTQTDSHPVVCVSWQDAQQYVDWLSQRTGASYRLPTEAEWEYIARADTQTPWFWGNDENNAGDYAWFSKNSNNQTQPVGQKKANDFGLYDTAGNVWEWTLDCWHQDYNQAPIDGTAWLDQQNGDCSSRVVRGGSWYSIPRNLRSADRDWGLTDVAYDDRGFRIARALL